MEPKKVETVEETFARIFRTPAKTSSQTELVLTRPAPPRALTREDLAVPEEEKQALAAAMEIVRTWLVLADGALTIAAFIIKNRELMDAAQHKQFVGLLNKTMDAMRPFEGVVAAVTRYTAKLQLLKIGIDRAYDAAEDYEFQREIKNELLLLG